MSVAAAQAEATILDWLIEQIGELAPNERTPLLESMGVRPTPPKAFLGENPTRSAAVDELTPDEIVGAARALRRLVPNDAGGDVPGSASAQRAFPVGSLVESFRVAWPGQTIAFRRSVLERFLERVDVAPPRARGRFDPARITDGIVARASAGGRGAGAP